MTKSETDLLHRRPPGPRLLIYLDQSARSRLAEGQFPDLLSVLRKGREAGKLLCPESSEHAYETVLTDEKCFKAIAELGDELAMGISFLDRDRIWRHEVRAAAAAFCGVEPPMPLFREAFAEDPHKPLNQIFFHGLRVTIEPEKVDWLEEEAQSEKDLSLQLQPIFEGMRGKTTTFEEQSEGAFRESVAWKLAPLVDPEAFAKWLAQSAREATIEMATGHDIGRTGSAFNKYTYRRALGDFAEYLRETYVGVRKRTREFLESPELRTSPLLRYDALLMAGLLMIPGRNAKRGDLYDIHHLAIGLSRCDIVTGDGGMIQMCRERKIIPAGVETFSSKEFDKMTDHLEIRLA